MSMAGKPLLGICLGMQMLADSGDEGSATSGLGLIGGNVRRLDSLGTSLRIPHVGWNDVTFAPGAPLFAHIPQKSDFYFVHSYAFEASSKEDVIASTEYGVVIAAALALAGACAIEAAAPAHAEAAKAKAQASREAFLAAKGQKGKFQVVRRLVGQGSRTGEFLHVPEIGPGGRRLVLEQPCAEHALVAAKRIAPEGPPETSVAKAVEEMLA